ncbi:unnamed protein product [Urochloa humidicola]
MAASWEQAAAVGIGELAEADGAVERPRRLLLPLLVGCGAGQISVDDRERVDGRLDNPSAPSSPWPRKKRCYSWRSLAPAPVWWVLRKRLRRTWSGAHEQARDEQQRRRRRDPRCHRRHPPSLPSPERPSPRPTHPPEWTGVHGRHPRSTHRCRRRSWPPAHETGRPPSSPRRHHVMPPAIPDPHSRPAPSGQRMARAAGTHDRDANRSSRHKSLLHVVAAWRHGRNCSNLAVRRPSRLPAPHPGTWVPCRPLHPRSVTLLHLPPGAYQSGRTSPSASPRMVAWRQVLRAAAGMTGNEESNGKR